MSFGLRRLQRQAMDGHGSRGTTERCPESYVLWSVNRYYFADVYLDRVKHGTRTCHGQQGTEAQDSELQAVAPRKEVASDQLHRELHTYQARGCQGRMKTYSRQEDTSTLFLEHSPFGGTPCPLPKSTLFSEHSPFGGTLCPSPKSHTPREAAEQVDACKPCCLN